MTMASIDAWALHNDHHLTKYAITSMGIAALQCLSYQCYNFDRLLPSMCTLTSLVPFSKVHLWSLKLLVQ